MQAAEFERELTELLVREQVSVKRIAAVRGTKDDWRVVQRMLLVAMALAKAGVMPQLEQVAHQVIDELGDSANRTPIVLAALDAAYRRLHAVALLCVTQRSIATREQYLDACTAVETLMAVERARRG